MKTIVKVKVKLFRCDFITQLARFKKEGREVGMKLRNIYSSLSLNKLRTGIQDRLGCLLKIHEISDSVGFVWRVLTKPMLSAFTLLCSLFNMFQKGFTLLYSHSFKRTKTKKKKAQLQLPFLEHFVSRVTTQFPMIFYFLPENNGSSLYFHITKFMRYLCNNM